MHLWDTAGMEASLTHTCHYLSAAIPACPILVLPYCRHLRLSTTGLISAPGAWDSGCGYLLPPTL